jgi:glycosyltransferase involved in cell wall biosynthesis
MKMLFVGAVNRGTPPSNGEEYKNQTLLDYLDQYHDVVVVDTKSWSREPLILVRLVWHFLIIRYDRILLSASSASVFRLLDSFRHFRTRMGKTIYFVIGGYLPKAISEGKYKIRAYQSLFSLVVEGESMRTSLKRSGITAKIHVVPNFKTVDRCRGNLDKFNDPQIRFIFLSRISEPKGLDTIFEAINDPRLAKRHQDFIVDFYGPIEAGYSNKFNQLLQSNPNCRYKGYLDFSNNPEESYETMAAYHVMLFPTYWMGEGFPGVIIDAFMCGIPVIATDWNMNSEVITEGKTGKLIPARNASRLVDCMLDVMQQPDTWKEMSAECHRAAPMFDTRLVLEENLHKII